MPNYELTDFNGEIYWLKINDNEYAVDPQYLEMFKEEILK